MHPQVVQGFYHRDFYLVMKQATMITRHKTSNNLFPTIVNHARGSLVENPHAGPNFRKESLRPILEIGSTERYMKKWNSECYTPMAIIWHSARCLDRQQPVQR